MNKNNKIMASAMAAMGMVGQNGMVINKERDERIGERIQRNNPKIENITGLYDRDTRQRRRAEKRAEAKKQVKKEVR